MANSLFAAFLGIGALDVISSPFSARTVSQRKIIPYRLFLLVKVVQAVQARLADRL